MVGTADEKRRSRKDADQFRKWRWRGEVIRGGEILAREAMSELHEIEGERSRAEGFIFVGGRVGAASDGQSGTGRIAKCSGNFVIGTEWR